MPDEQSFDELKKKELLFIEEVKQGLHPDWRVNQQGELEFIGEDIREVFIPSEEKED